jgi:hypothetical protein
VSASRYTFRPVAQKQSPRLITGRCRSVTCQDDHFLAHEPNEALKQHVRVAQLDSAPLCESGGRRCESCRGHQLPASPGSACRDGFRKNSSPAKFGECRLEAQLFMVIMM